MKDSILSSARTSSCRLGSVLRGGILVGLAMAVLASISHAGTTNVVLRLDAAQYESAVADLATWGDSSVYGHDATGYGNPEVVLDVQNGLPVVRFDGASDYVRVLHSYITGSAFIVAKYDGTTFGGNHGLYGAATGYSAAEQYWSGSTGGINWGNESGSGFQNSKYLNGSPSHTALTDPAKFNLYSGVDSTPASFTSWALGTDRGWTSGRLWDGDIAEVIVYDDALSDFDRQGVEVYLDEKWGLSLGLRASYGAGNFNDDPASLGLTPTATLALRLDASTFTSAESDLTTWADSSGNGYDATGLSDPAVVLGEQNSLPVVRLDGNDYFTISDTYAAGAVFAVAQYNTGDGNFVGHDGLYGATGGHASNIYFSGSAGSANWNTEAAVQMRGAKYDNGTGPGNSVAALGQWNLFSGIDTTPVSFSKHNIGADRSDTFGGSRAWDGDIGEIIVYEEALSAYDRRGVEVYLDEKWGLGNDLRTTYGEGNFNDNPYELGLTDPTMVLRLDASIHAATSALATWVDRSGNGHAATQGSSSYRPSVVADVQNGLSVVRCDGSDDYMTVAHSYTCGAAFIIAKYTSTTFNWYDGLYGSATDNGSSGIYWTGWNGSSSWDSGGSSSPFYNARYLNGSLSSAALTNPSKFNLYSGVDTTPSSFTSWSIGRDRGIGGRTWEGDIAEVVVYEEALSDFDRKGVEVYLDEKWGLNLGLRASYGAGNFNDDSEALGFPSGATLFRFR